MLQTPEPRCVIPKRTALYDKTSGKLEDALQLTERTVLTCYGEHRLTSRATESYMTIHALKDTVIKITMCPSRISALFLHFQ